jgi:hypothetical protein
MDVIGLAAATCVLATFCMQSMIALRFSAIASNVLFIIYAAGSHLLPILLLHAILLPINGWSLGKLLGNNCLALALGAGTLCISGILILAMM